MPDVAAFDFDGTLTEGGSVFGYLSALRGPAVVVPAALALAPRLLHAAVAGGTVADRTKEVLFERVLAGVALERAEEVGSRVRPRPPRPAPALGRPTPVRLAPRPRRPGGDRVGFARDLRPGGGRSTRCRRSRRHPAGREQRGCADRPLRRGELPRGREAPPSQAVDRRIGRIGGSAVGLRQQPRRSQDAQGRRRRGQRGPPRPGRSAPVVPRPRRYRAGAAPGLSPPAVLTGTPSSSSTPGRTIPRWEAGRR